MERARATRGGVLALAFWASTIGGSRFVSEQIGGMTAAAAIYLCAGVIGCARLAVSPERRRLLRDLPRPYWLACGALFVLYTVALYGAIAAARDRAQVVEVGLVNYLWPSLTLVFAIPVIGARARWTLLPGVVTAFAGVVLAATPSGDVPLAGLAQRLSEAPWPYALALVAAVSWGLYNPLGRRLAAGVPGDGVPVFILVSGLVLGVLAAFSGERAAPSRAVVLPILYLALFPTWLAYALWDAGMRRGHIVLLSSLSLCMPVFSTALSGLVLGVTLGARVWIACLLVVAGAAVCGASVRDPDRQG